MNKQSSLNRLKIRLERKNDDDDTLLLALLEEAYWFILGYTRRTEEQWLPAFNVMLLQIASISFNRLSAEGIQSRREGDISSVFYAGSDDLPKSILNTLNPYRLIKVAGL